MRWKSSIFWIGLTLFLGGSSLRAQVKEPSVFPLFPGDQAKEPLLPPPVPAPAEAGQAVPGPDPSKVIPPERLEEANKSRTVSTSLGVFGNIDLDEARVNKTRVFIMEGEYLLFAPRGNPSAVAVTGPTGYGTQGGYSDTIFIPGGYESGFRVGATWMNPERDADMTLKYTYFSWQSDVYSYAPVANNPIYYGNPTINTVPTTMLAAPLGGLSPTLLGPGYFPQVAQVSAKSNIQFQFADLEFGKQFYHDDWLAFRVFAGPRYAYLSQALQAQYSGGWVNTADYGSKVMFNGGGVRVGASADATLIGSLGLRFWGSASVVAGSYQGRVSQSINGLNNFTMNETTFGTIPILDAGIGLNCKGKGWSLLIGYELQTWLNVLQGYAGENGYYQARTQRQYGNLGFDGFTGLGVQTQFSW